MSNSNKSTDVKLSEALAEINELKARLKKLEYVDKINENLKMELEDTQKRCDEYEIRMDTLYQRIREPFKFVSRSPF